MPKIKLTRGKYALVDKEDLIRLSKLRWFCTIQDRAVANRDGGTVYMHRFIMGTPKGMETDHINGNPLDNRRANLRVCTHQENMFNRKLISKNNTSGYKGVLKAPTPGKWRARINLDEKLIYLGTFATREEAALAYNAAAKQYHKDFAKVNTLEASYV